MNKKLYFPCTVLRPILVSIPLAIILASAICLNHAVDSPMKLYPLMIFSGLAIIFTFVYFFRVITLSTDEIKIIGPFSSKDSAVINKDKTLIITNRGNGRIYIDLFGNNGVNADLDWLKNEETVHDIYLFKSSVLGNNNAIKRILLFFGIDESDAQSILRANDLYKEYPDYNISVSCTDRMREIRIKFTTTI